ncbi:MAG: alpha/beta hydrolase [Clostridia bacterium]|nr:alpha/beta hydrolase [Clostridia bacterium]
MTELYSAPFRGATHVEVLPEENFDEVMVNTVEPLLQRYRNKGFLTIVRGMRLQYEYYLCADPVGAVVICHGFTESAEKYREMTYYFLQAGYSVFAYDQRGHGRSYREFEDTSLTHIGKFQDYVNDLDLFIRKIVRPNAVNQPLYLFAHSMGGAVGGIYLSRFPVTFRRAVLNAPMIALRPSNVPTPLARFLARLACLTGNAKKRVVGFGGFNENESFEHACDSSQARFEYYRQKRLHYRHLRNCAPTYNWLLQSMGVTKFLLNRNNCATVQAPVLLFQAEQDTLVLPKPQEQYIARIPHGELVKVAETKHEVFMAENHVLQPYLDRVLAFFAK